MVFQHDRLLIRRQRLQLFRRRRTRKRPVSGDEDRNPGAGLVILEFPGDPRSGKHGSEDVEVVGVDEGASDVEAERRPVLGGSEVEVGGEEEGVDGENGEVVGESLEKGEDGGVGGGGRDSDGAGGREGEVDSAVSVEGAAGGLQESGNEGTGGGEATEVGWGEVLEEDVEAEGVGEGGGGGGGEAEEVVGDDEEGERGAGGEVGWDGGGGEEAGEVGEVWVGGEEDGDVKGRTGICEKYKEEKEDDAMFVCNCSGMRREKRDRRSHSDSSLTLLFRRRR
eukprot:TRINITY_DN37982_c0_g1_i1.p2 TRINITY_DN37982_c0_g1~~TRINITY_DN37982_c0_g1_i1.p2  ORF type:complete len:280 (+),score=80.91 TRINITY_DN37982_c0_g1_i1:1139-1978(+)